MPTGSIAVGITIGIVVVACLAARAGRERHSTSAQSSVDFDRAPRLGRFGCPSAVSTIQWHSSRPLPMFRCQRATSTGCRSERVATTGRALGRLSLEWTSPMRRVARRWGQMVRCLVRSMVRNFANAANIAHLLPQMRRSVSGEAARRDPTCPRGRGCRGRSRSVVVSRAQSLAPGWRHQRWYCPFALRCD